MLSRLLQIALLSITVGLLITPFWPVRTSAVHVISHRSTSHTPVLRFAETPTVQCRVPRAFAATLADGDALTLQHSQLLDTCMRLSQNGRILYTNLGYIYVTRGIAALMIVLILSLSFFRRQCDARHNPYPDTDSASEGGYFWPTRP